MQLKEDNWYTGFEIGQTIVWLPLLCGPTLTETPSKKTLPNAEPAEQSRA